MPSPIPILIVSGNPAHRELLAARVSSFGLESVCCETHEGAAELLGRYSFSFAFCDDFLPDGTFRAVIDSAARGDGRVPVIVTSRRDGWEPFLEVMNAGAFDYIVLPPAPGEIERVAHAALRQYLASPRAGQQLPVSKTRAA